MWSCSVRTEANLATAAYVVGCGGWTAHESPESASRSTFGNLSAKLWMKEGSGPSATVCTYGYVPFHPCVLVWKVTCCDRSNICRLAAVGLGWESAFDRKRWVDVDAKGTLAPIWAAFSLVD